jgi:hypothetical protein
MLRISLSLAMAALSALVLTSSVPGEGKPGPRTEPPAINLEQFHARLLAIAQSYPLYGRLDNNVRWAPTFCRAPLAVAHVSASKDTGTHGQKLYSLFVKIPEPYLELARQAPVGQVIIKESWVPQEVKDPARTRQDVLSRKLTVRTEDGKGVKEIQDRFLPYARKNDKLYHASRQGDLFIMYKLDPATPETDQGWVYGTVSADGKRVTSAGRVASCMSCHQQAKQDRLFGLKAATGTGK